MPDGFASAAHAYDNLTPEDFGITSDGHCDRCDTTTAWDDLRHVDDLDIYECKDCIAHGDGDAVGETWRRTCSYCGDTFGALLVPRQGWENVCAGCTDDRAKEDAAAAVDKLHLALRDLMCRHGAGDATHVVTHSDLLPFFSMEAIIERIEGEPSGWSKQMRRGLEIEARETDSLTSTPARRAVYSALLALPWGTDHE